MHLSTLSRLAALSLLVVALLGCQPTQAGPGLAFGAAPWKDGERATYDLVDKSGTKVGTSEMSYAKDGSAWVLSNADKAASVDQSSEVRVDASTLKPLSEVKKVKTQGTDATLNTTYKDGKLDIQAVVNGANKSASVDVPSNSLDNDQLLATLRALQFADGYEGKYVNVVGGSASKLDTTVRVQGKEQVEVPAGSFDTWKLELDFGQAKQYAWYQTDALNQLVQYDNGSTKMMLTK